MKLTDEFGHCLVRNKIELAVDIGAEGNEDNGVDTLIDEALQLAPYTIGIPADRFPHRWGFRVPWRHGVGASNVERSEHRKAAVSYTHLTLPTTPYV